MLIAWIKHHKTLELQTTTLVRARRNLAVYNLGCLLANGATSLDTIWKIDNLQVHTQNFQNVKKNVGERI